MYIIRNKEYEFVKSIDNNGMNYTRILSDAIMFDDSESAKLCKEFIDMFVDYENFTIYEISFEEVE